MARNERRVIFVEYHDGRPHAVSALSTNRGHDGQPYRTLEHCDFDWCERDGCLYWHLSGCGGDLRFTLYPCTGPYQVWAAPGVVLDRRDSKEGYHPATILDAPLPDWPLDRLFDLAEEGETEYCPTCDDSLPTDDSYHPCDHVHWCDGAGWWSKPGERCPADCPECLDRGDPTEADEWPLLKVAQGYGFAAADVFGEPAHGGI